MPIANNISSGVIIHIGLSIATLNPQNNQIFYFNTLISTAIIIRVASTFDSSVTYYRVT
jgi:hypothetical protein